MTNPYKKHFVVFQSPGSLFSEETSRRMESWDIPEAVKLSKTISERYGAKPYGFRFETRVVADPIPDGEGGTLTVNSKTLETSGIYYLGGELYTYDQVWAKEKDKKSILLSNMLCNRWGVIVENRNSYLTTREFNKEDFVVDDKGKIVARGDDPQWVAEREKADLRCEEWLNEHR